MVTGRNNGGDRDSRMESWETQTGNVRGEESFLLAERSDASL